SDCGSGTGLLLPCHAAALGTDSVFKARARPLGKATRLPVLPAGFQHALQFFVSKDSEIKISQCHESRVLARAYSASSGSFAGYEPRKQRSWCSSAQSSARSDSRFYA